MHPAPAAPTRPSVLLVDDDLAALDFYRALFRRAFQDVQVIGAASALEAETYLGLPGICAVVADYRLGADNGLELLSRVRGRFPALPRILLTGAPEWARNDPNLGAAHEVISKAEEPTRLMFALRGVLKQNLVQARAA